MDRDCYGREIVNRVRVGPATGLAVATVRVLGGRRAEKEGGVEWQSAST
jgi:hypothetical protein